MSAQNGTKARWAALDVGGEGVVEWACDIAPTEEVELELSREASIPIGKNWQNVQSRTA